jgi:flavin-dependent dehydrogenase
MNGATRDVIILGGGLAGLTLALQLRSRAPALSITVIERNRFPVREAAHKVGESTVEIGADYLANVIGLDEHLRTAHLKKFGFRFFFSEGREDIDAVTELGASDYLSTPGYQIDRGVLENHLARRVAEHGIELLSGATVREATLSDNGIHGVSFERDEATHTLSAHWVVDASGRAGLLRRKLDLQTDNGHYANAIWFRVGSPIRVDDWSTDPDWRSRCVRPERWLSTNHFVGPGYWAWLIPLAGGAHSVGIVADAGMHPLRDMNSFERALEWLGRHQPRVAEAVTAKRHELLDFAALRHFSYGCRRVFSSQRWALTGEAGLFLDPFYSPGTDFIAIANTYITDLIVRDRGGESVDMLAHIYEKFFFSFYESTLDLYLGQYRLFGHAEAMPAKVFWDYSYYWGVLAQLYFQRRLTDVPGIASLRQEFLSLQQVNREVQRLLRAWAEGSLASNPAQLIDQASLPWFAELNRSLGDTLDREAFIARLRANHVLLLSLAAEILERARPFVPASASDPLEKLLREAKTLPASSAQPGPLLPAAA